MVGGMSVDLLYASKENATYEPSIRVLLPFAVTPPPSLPRSGGGAEYSSVLRLYTQRHPRSTGCSFPSLCVGTFFGRSASAVGGLSARLGTQSVRAAFPRGAMGTSGSTPTQPPPFRGRSRSFVGFATVHPTPSALYSCSCPSLRVGTFFWTLRVRYLRSVCAAGDAERPGCVPTRSDGHE